MKLKPPPEDPHHQNLRIAHSNEVMDNWAFITSDQGIASVRLVGGSRAVEWRHANACNGPPLLASNKVFVSGDDGIVSAYAARTGERLWAQHAGTTPCQPVWCEGAVVVGTMDGGVHGYDFEDGTPLFREDVGGPVQGLTVEVNALYFSSFAGGGTLHKWLVVPGSPWTVQKEGQGQLLGGSAHPPVVVGKKVYVATVSSQLACFATEHKNRTLTPAWPNPVQLPRLPASGLAAVFSPDPALVTTAPTNPIFEAPGSR